MADPRSCPSDLGRLDRGRALGTRGHGRARTATPLLLLVNGRKEEEFVDWPASWTIEPDDSPGLAAQKAEFEYEMEKMEKNKDVLPIEEDEIKDDGA